MITTLLLLAATATAPAASTTIAPATTTVAPAIAAPATTPAATLDYTAAKALADRDEAAMTKLAADMLRRSQSSVLERAADKCRSDEKPAPFTVVLELDDKGRATNHWRSADSSLAKCMEAKLAGQPFYVPQKAPFYISFEVSFTP